MKKILLLAVAALVSIGAQAIDKVTKTKTALSGEITSVANLKSAEGFILVNSEAQVLCIPSGWDMKVQALADATSAQTYRYKIQDVADPAGSLFHCLVGNTSTTNTISWLADSGGDYGKKCFINRQPNGKNTIFGLGLANQFGQDGNNLALWTVTYSAGNGFVLESVGVAGSYLGYSGTAAAPANSAVYWKAYTGLTVEWDEELVNSTATTVKAACKYTALNTAIDDATTVDAKAAAVNAAIDAINESEAIITKHNALDAAGKAKENLASKYENGDYTTLDALKSAYVSCVKAQSSENAVMTDAIVNPSFETGDLTGWTSTNGGGIAGNMNFGANIVGQKFVERWTGSGNKLSDGTLLQTVTGLPNGTYKLSANMQNLQQKDNSNGTGFYLVLNSAKTDCTEPGKVEVEGVVTDGTITIGVKLENCTGNWMCVDNFELTYVNSTVTITEEAATELLGKVPSGKMGATAETNLTSAKTAFEADKTDAGKYNTLKSAIDAANSSIAYYAIVTPYATIYANLDATGKAAVESPANSILGSDYENGNLDESSFPDAQGMLNNWAIGNLKKGIKANTTPGLDVSAFIVNPSFTNDKSGWTTNMGIQGNTEFGANNKYAEKWQPNGDFGLEQTISSMPAGTYKLTVKGIARGLSSANLLMNSTKSDITISDAKTEFEMAYVLDADGDLKIGAQCIGTGAGASWFAVDDFKLIKIASEARATDTNKYGTICLPYAFSATGATIYSASLNAAKDAVVLEEVSTPVAGTPYIYKATAAAQEFTYTSGAVVAAPVAAAPLVGVFTATEVPVGAYVMQTQGGVQKFYKVAADNQPTLSANKAYLTTGGGSVKELTIGGEETAIQAIEALTSGEAKIYDLNGRQLKSLQKGINIVNGVKVLVK